MRMRISAMKVRAVELSINYHQSFVGLLSCARPPIGWAELKLRSRRDRNLMLNRSWNAVTKPATLVKPAIRPEAGTVLAINTSFEAVDYSSQLRFSPVWWVGSLVAGQQFDSTKPCRNVRISATNIVQAQFQSYSIVSAPGPY